MAINGPAIDIIKKGVKNMQELTSYPIPMALLVIILLITVDALLGAINAIKAGEFNFTKLPQFLAVNVLPYVGGILIVGLVAGVLPEPFNEVFSVIFYGSAAAVSLKYVLEVYAKLSHLFGIDIKSK